MNRAHSAIVRTCSWLVAHKAAWIIGLAVISLATVPRPAWSQWNGTNPVWTNSNVGIGTASPAYRLDVGGFISQSCNSGAGIPAERVTGSAICTNFVSGQSAVDFWNTAAGYYGGFQFHQLTGSGTQSTLLTITGAGNVGIGTANPQYKLAVNGNIGAKDIIVTNTGLADYVFRPGYRLRPLSEVNAYIQKHHHLPDIPTEAEVKEKGVSLGDMQAKLLAKVEELTLHLIQQEKENKDLRERLAQLENRVAASGGDASGPVR